MDREQRRVHAFAGGRVALKVEVVEVRDRAPALSGAAQDVQEVVGHVAGVRVLGRHEHAARELAVLEVERLVTSPSAPHAAQHARVGRVRDHPVAGARLGMDAGHDVDVLEVVEPSGVRRRREGVPLTRARSTR